MFLWIKNKLQPKANLNSKKKYSCKLETSKSKTSPGQHDRLQVAPECKNVLYSCAPMCTPTQEKQPQPSQKNPYKSKKISFADPT
jgi:hypothetical protein